MSIPVFPFFARRTRLASRQARNRNARRSRCISVLWHRREQTTFHKCLAVHMYYAARGPQQN
jgi:hypothetical protein